MSTTHNVAVIVGSLRQGSFNRMTAKVLLTMAPPALRPALVEIGDLPLYNQDLDNAPPAPWTAFRAQVADADAVLLVTPEYNRSIPGALKNAIDVGSRPSGHSVWNGKPTAIISVSPGAIGGFGANHSLRQAMVFLNMPVMQQPEAYIGGAAALFDKDGNLINDGTRKFLQTFIDAFAVWVEKLLRPLPSPN